jgi:hypothetical protein
MTAIAAHPRMNRNRHFEFIMPHHSPQYFLRKGVPDSSTKVGRRVGIYCWFEKPAAIFRAPGE